jgi:enoyl-[acyl-carrier-protein] reductase (NADH)
VPTRRWIEPDEIASAVVALVGDDFSALHGANVMIDAGYDAWGGHF